MNRGRLHLDIESRSTCNLQLHDADIYWRDPDTEPLVVRWLFSVETDQGFMLDLDPTACGEWRRGWDIPVEVTQHIEAGGECRAWNCSFEEKAFRYNLGPKHGWAVPSLHQWVDTMEESREQAYPARLGACGTALGLDVVKDNDGHRLMMRMCKPLDPDVHPPQWLDDDESMDRLSLYCAIDVVSEALIMCALDRLPEFERAMSEMTQRMNKRGITVDVDLLEHMATLAQAAQLETNTELQRLTDGAIYAMTQNQRLMKWINTLLPEDDQLTTLAKEDIEDILAGVDPTRRALPELVIEVLELRLAGSKTSLSKIPKALACVRPDGTIADQFVHCGASRTKRYSSHGVQFQNIIRDVSPRECMDLIRAESPLLDPMYGPVSKALSESLRHMIIAAPGHVLFGGDYSQVESRMTAAVAGQMDKVQRYADGEDVYRGQGAEMFGLKPEQISDWQRQASKTTELACGFGGAYLALMRMSRKFGMHLDAETAKDWVTRWRTANKWVVDMWWEADKAARSAIKVPGQVYPVRSLTFMTGVERGNLNLYLTTSSGSVLQYSQPELAPEKNKFGNHDITYMHAAGNAWYRRKIYGAKFFQNAIQNVCRDLMGAGMLRLEAAGYLPIATIHDEPITQRLEGTGSVDEFRELMLEPVPWMPDLPLEASAWTDVRYRK